MKLPAKLTLLFLLLSLAPLILVSYWAYISSRHTIENNTQHRLVAATIFKRDEFNRWLRASSSQLRLLANRPLLREYAQVLVNPNATAAEQMAAHDQLLSDHFGPTLQEHTGFMEFYLLDSRTGQILASSNPALEGMIRENEAYFIKGRQETYIDNVRYSLSLGAAVMHVSTPVKNKAGKVVAVLAGHLDLSIMSEIMAQESGLNPTEETYLVNAFNFFVTNPKFGGDVALKKAVYTPGVQACLAHQSGVGLYNNYRDVPVMGAYRWLPEQELCILTEVDQAEAYAPIYRLRDVMIGVGGLVMAGVAILAIFFARSITGPIQQLVQGAEAIGQGDLAYRLNVSGRDEISELAAAFNQMAARREQNEQALQDQQIFLQSIYHGVELAIFVIDVTADNDFRFAGLNPTHERLTGLKSDDVHGQRLEDIMPHIPPQTIATIRANYERCLEAGQAIEYEEMIPFDGREMWWLTRLSPVRNTEGRIYRIIGSSTHITARKQMEDELRRAHDELELRVQERTAALSESEEQLRRAVVDAPFPIMIHAEDGQVIITSRTWTTLTGYTPAEISTIADWTERAYGVRKKLVQADIDRLYGMQEKIDEGEYEITARNGRVLTWAFSSAPLGRLPDGQRTVISMAMDVTERKRAEVALAEKAKELARSNKELEQFAYVASHDLQEPLRMVSSYLQLLERRYADKLDTDAHEFIAYAVNGAIRMKVLINDLLAYSRVGTHGKVFAPTNCETVLERVLNNLQLAIEDTGAVITHDPLPTVPADSNQLELVLQNLINNALKFHSEAPPQIHVGAIRRDNCWQFWVQDNGIGFEPEFAEKIFIIFQRLHGKEEYPGTGIGLAICKKIIERHGGHIWVESQPGQGATFYFSLPATNHAALLSE